MSLTEAGKERSRKDARALVIEAEARLHRAERVLMEAARRVVRAEDELEVAEEDLRRMR